MGCRQSGFEDEEPVRKSFHGGMDQSLHGNLIRHRTKEEFDQIYQRVEELGTPGVCKVFKIRKVVHGGSASSTYVLRQQKGLKANMNPEVRKARRRELSTLQDLEVYLALKEINLTMLREDQIAPLKNEVELLKLLDHPNIIRLFETYEFNDGTRNSIGVIMELCTGGDLHARMPYSEQEAARITKQILLAVSYMHDRHVTHRDLKLENILFENGNPEACIKVIDFGLSKRYNSSNNILTERVGTLYSMSPETMKGIYTSQADLWSIGVIAYTLLSGGEKPFQAQTP
jgi:serine/threonine protein kinase